MKNILRISALLSVMLALLLTFSVMAITPTAQIAQVPQISQQNDAVVLMVARDTNFSSPPVVADLSSGFQFISAQRFKIEITVLHPADFGRYTQLVIQVGADPKIHAEMVSISTPTEYGIASMMELKAGYRLTNDAGGKMVAVEIKNKMQFNAEIVNGHFYS